MPIFEILKTASSSFSLLAFQPTASANAATFNACYGIRWRSSRRMSW